jgi:hypothetical protein
MSRSDSRIKRRTERFAVCPASKASPLDVRENNQTCRRLACNKATSLDWGNSRRDIGQSHADHRTSQENRTSCAVTIKTWSIILTRLIHLRWTSAAKAELLRLTRSASLVVGKFSGVEAWTRWAHFITSISSNRQGLLSTSKRLSTSASGREVESYCQLEIAKGQTLQELAIKTTKERKTASFP